MSNDSPELDLTKSIQSVKYEYQMAYEMATRGSRILRPKTYDEFVLAVALLESFLVHARVLHEFLSAGKGRRTDLKANRFVPKFGERIFDEDTIDSINRALQHLTVYRQDGHIGWYPLPMLGQIVAVMDRFIGALEGDLPEMAAVLAEIHQKATAVTSTGTP